MSSTVRAALCAAVLVLGATGPALALEAPEVSVRGANVAIVYERIVQAARTVCRQDYVRQVHTLRDLRACEADTVEDAVRRSGRQDLMAFHTQWLNRPSDQSVLAAVD